MIERALNDVGWIRIRGAVELAPYRDLDYPRLARAVDLPIRRTVPEWQACGFNSLLSHRLTAEPFIPAVEAALSQLEGILADPVLSGDYLLWSKRGQAYWLGWHRDRCSSPRHPHPDRSRTLIVTVALLPETVMRAVEGTHCRDLTDREQVAVHRGGPPPSLPGDIWIELQPGDLLVFDGCLLHAAQSAQRTERLALHMSFRERGSHPGNSSARQSELMMDVAERLGCLRAARALT
jgi:ectoine hydroxylase-related dioxygenase (phytanoyl-CoA dioxygenase family)